jgi:hypothetical protein
MKGRLFTENFLIEGIVETRSWADLGDEAVLQFKNELRRSFRASLLFPSLNEADTEDKIIIPTLKALGWYSFLRQRSAGKHRSDVPDILLFPDPQALQKALALKKDATLYLHGIAFVESKHWERALDRADQSDPLE